MIHDLQYSGPDPLHSSIREGATCRDIARCALLAGLALAAALVPGASAGNAIAREHLAADLFLSPAVVKDAVAKGTILVDVRAPQDFEAVRIPGSLNIPLFAVKHKRFLRSREFVLLNEGYACRQLAQTAEALNKSGFRARILHGGLNAWRNAGGALTGLPGAQTQLNLVPPIAAQVELQYPHWYVVDVSATQVANAPSFPGNVVRVPFPADTAETAAFLAAWEAALGEAGLSPTAQVLVVDRDETVYSQVAALIPAKWRGRTFYLKGGTDGYSRFRRMHEAMLKPRPAGKRVDGCTSCP